MIEWCHIICAAGPFLCGADAPFDVWDVFVLAADIQVGVDVGGDGATRALEFRVADNQVDAEPALAMDTMDSFEGLHK